MYNNWKPCFYTISLVFIPCLILLFKDSLMCKRITFRQNARKDSENITQSLGIFITKNNGVMALKRKTFNSFLLQIMVQIYMNDINKSLNLIKKSIPDFRHTDKWIYTVDLFILQIIFSRNESIFTPALIDGFHFQQSHLQNWTM